MELKKHRKEAVAKMPYFPNEILEEIFLRLPRKSVMRFKCMSKYFCGLFGSPSFQNMHHELINFKKNRWVTLYDQAKNNKRHTTDFKSVSSLLPLSSSSSATMCDCHELVYDKEYTSVFQDYDKVVRWSSCSCLRWMEATKGSCGQFYIWNTVTKLSQKVPMTPGVNYNNVDAYGFCYDSNTKDYKFIMVTANRDAKCSEVNVYTLGAASWKRIPSIPYSLDYPYYLDGVKFKGVPHWLAHTFDEERYAYTKLVRFDIVNERFEEVAMPEEAMPYTEEPLEKDKFDITVQEFERCLCLVFHVFSVRVDVWMMQEYGVKHSWAKIFSSTLENLTTSKYSTFIWFFKNNESLWRVDYHGDLILYDPNHKIYRKLVLDSDHEGKVTVAEN